MTREQIKKHKNVMLAYANGERIEYYNPTNGAWFRSKNPLFEINVEYRVEPKFKPEQGEMIRVSKNRIQWNQRIYLGREDDKYICLAVGNEGYNQYICNNKIKITILDWKYIKPLNN